MARNHFSDFSKQLATKEALAKEELVMIDESYALPAFRTELGTNEYLLFRL